MAAGLIGVVMAGGESRRMGRDKSELIYFDVSQREYLYQILGSLCTKAIISAHSKRTRFETAESEILFDLPEYDQTGPIAGILTTFSKYPDHDLLVVGCDYPYLTQADLSYFLGTLTGDCIAATFCGEPGQYEPLLAWYSREALAGLKGHFAEGKHSLRDYLRRVNATKFFCENRLATKSADTPEDFEMARKHLAATQAGTGCDFRK